MASDSNPDPLAWASAMQKSLGEMMKQWTELSSPWVGAPAGGSGDAAATSAEAGAEFARRLATQFEQYLGISGALWELAGKAATAGDAEQRVRYFDDGLNALRQKLTGLWASTPFGVPPAGVATPFAFTSDGSNPFVAMGIWPGSAKEGAWFDLPALGLTREHQESWRRLAERTTRFAQAHVNLVAEWNDIIADGMRELGSRLEPRVRSGAAPGSMKEIYDLWVESAESVYASAAHGAKFMQAQAELTNAASQLRIAQRELIEEWSRQLDLPTRAELNALHQQIRELKSALHKLGG